MISPKKFPKKKLTRFSLKDVNPFNTLLEGAWDSLKISLSKSNFWPTILNNSFWIKLIAP